MISLTFHGGGPEDAKDMGTSKQNPHKPIQLCSVYYLPCLFQFKKILTQIRRVLEAS